MKKNSKIFQSMVSLLLTLLMVMSTFVAIPVITDAANVTKTEKTYDIAVVFDNSGSMYEKTKSWCRAKYSMEIFASMLNYDKDKLIIFPMWEVITDGSTPSSGGSKNPIEIKSKQDIDKISNMYTPRPSGTPFSPVEDAYKYLQEKSKADEKWLIVLTDGKFDGMNVNTMKTKLLAMASGGIKVQYLGIGDALAFESDSDKNNLFSVKSTDDTLKDDLVVICNTIFSRDDLDDKYLKGKTLSIDLSMKNIIVFAQGKNAKITSLKDSKGNEINISLDSGVRKYSEIGNGTYSTEGYVDTTLYGQVVTFSSCPKDTYTLEYTGADKIEIFYEPDVDINVVLRNESKEEIRKGDDLAPGKYTITTTLVDGTTGEDVSNHPLLGNTDDLTTYVKTSKDSTAKPLEGNPATIELNEDSETEIYVEGTYLEKYKISSKDDPNLSWLLSLDIKEPEIVTELPTEPTTVAPTTEPPTTAPPPPPKKVLKLDVKAQQDWYTLSKHDEWEPVKINLTVDDKPLTEKQMKNTTVNVEVSGNLQYRLEAKPDESAYYIYIAQDEKGNYTEPDVGRYKISASATFVDENGDKSDAKKDSVSIEIQKYSKIWRILIWIIILLILFLIWLAFMLQKVLPKSIIKDTANFVTMKAGELDASFVEVSYSQKGKTLTIAGSNSVDYDEQCSLTLSLRAVDNRFVKSKSRRIGVIGIDSPCEEIKLAGTKYVNYEGRWVKNTDLRKAETGKEVPPLDQEISGSARFEVSRSGGMSVLTCKTKAIK